MGMTEEDAKRIEEELKRKERLEKLKQKQMRESAKNHQTPHKNSDFLIKYLPLILLLAVIGFGMYKFGPDIWKNIGPILPDSENSPFFLYLDCIWMGLKGLFTGDITPIQACFESINQEPDEETKYEVLSILTGFGDSNKLYTPVAGLKYSLPVKIKNNFKERPVQVEVSGLLTYDYYEMINNGRIEREGQIELNPDPDVYGKSPKFELPDDSYYIVELVSEEELNCSVESYKSIVNVNYSEYSTSREVGYIVAQGKEELNKAKKPKSMKTPGPIEIDVEFSLGDYYPDLDQDRLNVLMTFQNKVSQSEAKITGIKVERKGDEGDKFLEFDKCNCPNWDKTFDDEGKRIDVEGFLDPGINIALKGRMEHSCSCIYEIESAEDFLKGDPYKTVMFNVTVFYDFSREMKKSLPEIDDHLCFAEERI